MPGPHVEISTVSRGVSIRAPLLVWDTVLADCAETAIGAQQKAPSPIKNATVTDTGKDTVLRSVQRMIRRQRTAAWA